MCGCTLNEILNFREFYKDVIFLYISDDMEWGKKVLGAKNMDDLYFVSEGNAAASSR